MTNIVIFRNNELLKPMSEWEIHADWVRVVFPEGTSEETILTWFRENRELVENAHEVILDGTAWIAASVTKVTLPHLTNVISQTNGDVREHITETGLCAVALGIGVVVVRNNIAHHCELNGRRWWSLPESSQKEFHVEVLQAWRDGLTAVGVTTMEVDTAEEAVQLGPKWLVVVDSHNRFGPLRVGGVQPVGPWSWADRHSSIEHYNYIKS